MADMFDPTLACAPWWQHRPLLQRYVRDLLAAQWLALRPGQLALAPEAWSDATRIDQDLGADSLELMNLATSLSTAIHLHESGIEDYLLARRSFGQWVDVAAAGLERFCGALTFSTSGSTGTAKPCTHALDSLQQEVAVLAGLFAGRRRIVVAVPAHHIYGFVAVSVGVGTRRDRGCACQFTGVAAQSGAAGRSGDWLSRLLAHLRAGGRTVARRCVGRDLDSALP